MIYPPGTTIREARMLDRQKQPNYGNKRVEERLLQSMDKLKAKKRWELEQKEKQDGTKTGK